MVYGLGSREIRAARRDGFRDTDAGLRFKVVLGRLRV